MGKRDKSWWPLIISIIFSIIILGAIFARIQNFNENDQNSREIIDLTLSFENDTTFIFQMPVLYLIDRSGESQRIISPALIDLKIIEGESIYKNIDISIITNTTIGIEYIQINGTGLKFTLQSDLLVRRESIKTDFTQIRNNAIYLKTNNDENMSLSLEYFAQDAVYQGTTGCQTWVKLFDNTTIVNGWKFYGFNELITTACR